MAMMQLKYLFFQLFAFLFLGISMKKESMTIEERPDGERWIPS